MHCGPDRATALGMNESSLPEKAQPHWQGRHLAALLLANLSMGFVPLFVRIVDVGPAAVGMWRHVLALPMLAALVWSRESVSGLRLRGPMVWMVLGGGVLFGLNLAAAYIGFGLTRLGNVVLLGNSGGLILMAWGVLAARRLPRALEAGAILAAIAGVALLLGGSLDMSVTSFRGDLLGLVSGVCYAAYLLLMRHARAAIGQFTLLLWVTLSSLPVLLAVSVALGEGIVPQVWWPIVAMTLCGHVIGQGLLVYALPHFPPLMLGLILLMQPALSAALGWMFFGEALGGLDMLGMALLAAALVISRAAEGSQPVAASRG